MFALPMAARRLLALSRQITTAPAAGTPPQVRALGRLRFALLAGAGSSPTRGGARLWDAFAALCTRGRARRLFCGLFVCFAMADGPGGADAT